MVGILASGPSYPAIFSEETLSKLLRLINEAWLEESGQWLENDDRTHLVGSQ